MLETWLQSYPQISVLPCFVSCVFPQTTVLKKCWPELGWGYCWFECRVTSAFLRDIINIFKSTVQLSPFVNIRKTAVKLPGLNLSMGLTQKESVLYTVWKAEGISSLSRHSNTTARLPHSQISINSLPSTIQSREVTLFPRKKESWRQVCCLNGAWVQGKVRAALAPAMRTLVSASWLSRIHSGSSLSAPMWPVSDFCLLSRQLAEMHNLFSLAVFFTGWRVEF